MRSDAKAKRNDLLEAAWRLHVDQGGGVSLRSVAQEAGVGIATLYRHFPAREDLSVSLAEQVLVRVQEVAANQDDRLWASNPAQAWRQFVQQLAALRIATLVTALFDGPDDDEIERIGKRTQASRATMIELVDVYVERARAAQLVEADLTTPQFYSGLSILTRPLPPAIARTLPDWQPWIVERYIRGLMPIEPGS